MRVKETFQGLSIHEHTLNENQQYSSKILKQSVPFLRFMKSAFLPQGYPKSVSEDYMEYQIWDTIQALASTIVGMLAGQSILVGVGVGDAAATVLGASATWMFKDGAGMIGRIWFASWRGTTLDSQCKQWRLFADALNDGALFLELMSGYLPLLFIPIICISSVMKSLVSVAGGATRAAITQHQAIKNNMADVAAKDSSQETLSNLLGLLMNFLFVYMVTGNWILIWLTFFILTPLHLYANWRAVRCLQFTTLNRARFKIVVQQWLKLQEDVDSTATTIMSPVSSVEEVNLAEPIICIPFRRYFDSAIYLGCSFDQFARNRNSQVLPIMEIFKSENYILYCPQWKSTFNSHTHLTFYICLHNDSDLMDQMKALLHVYLISSLRALNILEPQLFASYYDSDNELGFLSWSLSKVNMLTPKLMSSLKQANSGWSMDTVHFDADEWRIDFGRSNRVDRDRKHI